MTIASSTSRASGKRRRMQHLCEVGRRRRDLYVDDDDKAGDRDGTFGSGSRSSQRSGGLTLHIIATPKTEKSARGQIGAELCDRNGLMSE